MVIRYRLVDGKVVKDVLTSGGKFRGEDRPPRHFSERLLKSYYQLECSEGSRFRSGYSKGQIKKVHETAIERFEATGVES